MISVISFDENAFLPKGAINRLRSTFYENIFYRILNIKCDTIAKYTNNSICLNSKINYKNSIIIDIKTSVSDDITDVIYSPLNYNDNLSEVINFYKNKRVWLYIPPFATDSDVKLILKNAKNFYGVYGEGYWVIKLCEEYNLKLYAGCGFNIFNSIDINTLNCYNFIENFVISKELSFSEIKDLGYNFTVLNSSKLQIMDLIYCPFNKTCNDCKYQNNCYLQDDV